MLSNGVLQHAHAGLDFAQLHARAKQQLLAALLFCRCLVTSLAKRDTIRHLRAVIRLLRGTPLSLASGLQTERNF